MSYEPPLITSAQLAMNCYQTYLLIFHAAIDHVTYFRSDSFCNGVCQVFGGFHALGATIYYAIRAYKVRQVRSRVGAAKSLVGRSEVVVDPALWGSGCRPIHHDACVGLPPRSRKTDA